MIPPCPMPFNLAAYVLNAGQATPDKIALSLVSADAAQDWTYAELTQAVRGTAGGLLSLGLMPGDRVLLRLGNTPDFPIAYLGALAAGLVPVPTAAALTEHEVGKLIQTLRPSAILRDPDVPCPEHGLTVDLADLHAMRSLPQADYQMGDPDRLGYIIYTSGTSGKPSAVMHAHRAIWARRMMFDGWYGLTADDRVLHAGAFNWTYTLGTGLMDPWTAGATALIPLPGTAPSDLAQLIEQHRATIFAAAPGVYRQMLRDMPPSRFSRLRHGLSAGEKMADAVIKAWQDRTSTPVFEAFGMSECSTFISGSPANPAKPGAIGTPQPGRKVAIRTPEGTAPPDTVGTIAVHQSDPGLMLGYLDAPEETRARFDGEWFLTGDQATMDANGQITYLGRADDMMNAGGFRVSPLEVENSLRSTPGLTGIAVTEVEVKDGASVIAAFYTADGALDDADLTACAERSLARYKQPRIFMQIDNLPLGPNGKLSRRRLREYFKERQP